LKPSKITPFLNVLFSISLSGEISPVKKLLSSPLPTSLFVFGEKSPNIETTSNFWRKFPFFSKRIRQTSPLFGGRVAISMSTRYSFNDPE